MRSCCASIKRQLTRQPMPLPTLAAARTRVAGAGHRVDERMAASGGYLAMPSSADVIVAHPGPFTAACAIGCSALGPLRSEFCRRSAFGVERVWRRRPTPACARPSSRATPAQRAAAVAAETRPHLRQRPYLRGRVGAVFASSTTPASAAAARAAWRLGVGCLPRRRLEPIDELLGAMQRALGDRQVPGIDAAAQVSEALPGERRDRSRRSSTACPPGGGVDEQGPTLRATTARSARLARIGIVACPRRSVRFAAVAAATPSASGSAADENRAVPAAIFTAIVAPACRKSLQQSR